MQLINTEKKNRFNIYFNERETENLRVLLNSQIHCSNMRLCYCIEKALPMKFKQFKNKRAMVMDIFNGYNYITATVEAQKINIKFKKPFEKFFNVTQVSFSDIRVFKNWKKEKFHLYKIKNVTKKGVLVTVFNLTLENELALALNEKARIISKCNIIEYMFNKTINVFRECFQN